MKILITGCSWVQRMHKQKYPKDIDIDLKSFGGQGLSGTGPKAGGPFYLHRLATERTVSIDTTAAGGNATLMHLAQ